MKTKPSQLKQKWPRGMLAALTGLALVCSGGLSLAQDLNVNTFDFGMSGIAWQSWRSYVTGHSLEWESAQDADTNANSGALHVTVNWPAKGGGWNNGWNDVQVAFNAGTFASSNYIEVEAYIKIDVANSFTAGDGTYGVAGLYLNGGDGNWQQVQGYAVLAATDGWQRIHGFLSAIPDKTYDQVVLGLISSGDGSPTNTIAYWIDNVRLTAPPSVNTNQPPLTIVQAPPPGLTCMASAPDDAWQRQMIRTVDSNYSWDTSTAASNTTTYSMSLAAFPSPAHSGFEAMMYLIPTSGMPSGPDDSSVDWDSSHVLYFVVSGNADGTAKGNFRYKVNDPGAEHFQSWTDVPCATGPLGKWSLSFNQNTNVTITTPAGNTASVTMPTADAALFQGALMAYFGIRPADASRIGQSATFNRIQITGAAAAIDDTFSQGALNSGTWTRKASHPPGIFITASGAKCWLTWPTPDVGFTDVYATDDITKHLGASWKVLPASATGWVLVGGSKRLAVIDQSALNAAFGSVPARCFFGLWQVLP